VAERLNSVIEEGLEGQEYVSLLQWVEQTYPGPELMASPALGKSQCCFLTLIKPFR
jgi:exocyst complex component 3